MKAPEQIKINPLLKIHKDPIIINCHYYSIRDCARTLKISPNTIKKFILELGLYSFRKGRRVLITSQTFERLQKHVEEHHKRKN